MSALSYITALEHDPYWQATAEIENGQRLAIMRGHSSGRFDAATTYMAIANTTD